MVARLSPNGRARLAGIFEFLEGTASAAGQVVILGSVVVLGDAAATAHNILAHESLYRLGFLISIAGVAFHLTWALLMYQLLRPFHATIAAVALLIVVVCATFQAITAFTFLAPLLVLQGSLGGLTPVQAQGLAAALLKLNTAAFQIDLVFFGLWCVLTGFQLSRAKYMPRILGYLLMVDGLGWTLYVWPPLAIYLFPVIAVVSACAELPLQFWLIVFGVNNKKYEAQVAEVDRAHEAEQLGRLQPDVA